MASNIITIEIDDPNPDAIADWLTKTLYREIGDFDHSSLSTLFSRSTLIFEMDDEGLETTVFTISALETNVISRNTKEIAKIVVGPFELIEGVKRLPTVKTFIKFYITGSDSIDLCRSIGILILGETNYRWAITKGEELLFMPDIIPEATLQENESSEKLPTPPDPPNNLDAEAWLLYRLEMMPFGFVNILSLREIASKTGYSYDAIKQKNIRLCEKLRKKYGLEEFKLSP